jgi:hypothetical protein
MTIEHTAIETNANTLIEMGKEAWLKSRRKRAVVEMSEQEQNYKVRIIEDRIHRGDNVKPWRAKNKSTKINKEQ